MYLCRVKLTKTVVRPAAVIAQSQQEVNSVKVAAQSKYVSVYDDSSGDEA
jgi:hypothetical protein